MCLLHNLHPQMVLMLVDVNNHQPTFPPAVYVARVSELITSANDILEGINAIAIILRSELSVKTLNIHSKC